MKFYGTFGQGHFHNIEGNYTCLKDYYTEIFTEDYLDAVKLMIQFYLSRWGTIYEYEEFDKSFYPKGIIKTLGTKTPEDEADEIIRNIYEQRRNNRKTEELGDNNGECLPKE